MAFNFFGTFTTGQFEAFRAFTKIQQLDLTLRQQWLSKQLIMNGVFDLRYNGPIPVSFSASGYAGKLLQAYRVLGGCPEECMLLRTRDQCVFKTKNYNMNVAREGGVSGGFSDLYTSGRRERGGQRYDRDLGIKVDNIKKWEREAIKKKREQLEMKIRRALDYSDQLQEEIKLIAKLLGDGKGSVDDQILQVDIQAATPGSMNVVRDLNDMFGLFIGRVGDITQKDALDQEQEQAQRLQT